MADRPLRAPTGVEGLRELRFAREPLRLLARPHRLTRRARPGRLVITAPGYGTTDISMAPLRAYLRRRGHRASGAGIGRTHGDVEIQYLQLGETVRALASSTGETVDLVGWSLGGVLAREVARDLPAIVGRVITYGTPVVGGPRFTRAAAAFGHERLEEIERVIGERERTPITVPVTAIYSRLDGIVDWRACLDPFDNDVEHVEVRSSHIGMGLDPDVWHIIDDRLSHERPSHDRLPPNPSPPETPEPAS